MKPYLDFFFISVNIIEGEYGSGQDSVSEHFYNNQI